jgi:hypothetical protein
MKLSRIFEIKPQQWGLRGDSYLWDEMKETFEELDIPESQAQFLTLFTQTYENLTGKPLSHMEPIYVERYAHGGMSSGRVCPKFWNGRGLEFLKEKYQELGGSFETT